ncbi:MAG: MBL fold metallo-hydrolase [Nitrososphaerales archaeon]
MIEAKVLFSKSSIGTQILLTHGESSLLVDAGDGALRDLTDIQFQFENLKAILITHEHADHTGGLFSLLHFMKHLPRSDSLYILAPRPVQYLGSLLEKPLMYSELPFKVVLKEMEEGDNFSLDPFEISPFRAEHVDFDSMGYNIRDIDGYKVVLSGDTRASSQLDSAVRGADLAILESTFEDGQEKYAEVYGHMTVSEATRVGKLAKKTILVHQMPQDYFAKMTCADIS